MKSTYASATVLLLSIPSSAIASAERAEAAEPACILTEKWDTLAGQTFSSQHADCRYAAIDFQKRLLSVFMWPANDLNVETLERTFSLPPLKTSYDAPRDANYRVYANGPASDNQWRASFAYQESFTPGDAWRRPRFRGAKRPILINPRIRGERQVQIEIFLSPKGEPQPCFAESIFRAAARRSGWREPTGINIVVPTLHGSMPLPTTVFERGRWSVSVIFDRERKCAEELIYGTEADPGAN